MKPRTLSIKKDLDSAKAAIEAAQKSKHMENKDTAVEWMEQKLSFLFGNELTPLKGLFEVAKKMEKDQIVQAFNEGALDGLQLGEQYYNFVFKS